MLTANNDPLSNDADEAFKVWPTNADQPHFRAVMTCGSPLALARAHGQAHEVSSLEHPILDGYLFFHDRIRDWMHYGEPDFEQRLEVLYRAVREFLRLVVIDLGPEDDAQLIFETLNARGTPLLPSDLVKNYLFHRAQGMGMSLEPLHRRYWQPFDERHSYWREELGRGHAKRARIDTFFANYLTLRVRDEVPAGHLYTAFRDHVGPHDNPETQLRSLCDYAEIFRSFSNASRASSFLPAARSTPA